MKHAIEVESPSHRPFTIASLYSYFIGHLDLVPDGIGYHKKGEMNGLWYPPIRALKNIHIMGRERILKPKHAKIEYSSAKFTFDDMRLYLSFEHNGDFIISVRNDSNDIINIVVDLLPETVWDSVNDTNVTISKQSVMIFSHMFPETRLRITGTSEFSIKDGKLSLSSARKGSLRISSVFLNPVKTIRKINRYGDIDKFSILEIKNEAIARNFSLAKDNLIRLSLLNQGIGYGLTAGHPDFPWYFGIDALLSINGIMDSGFFELALGSLNILARFSKSGKIPHEILTSGKVYNDGDLEETAIFPFAVFRYSEWTGDTENIEHLMRITSESFRYLFDFGLHGRGIMEDSKADQGIDIDTVSFAIMSLMELEKISNQNQVIANEIADKVKPGHAIDGLKKLLQSFWLPERNTYANRIMDGVPIDFGFWTSIVPFYAGLADPEYYRSFVCAQGGLPRISNTYGIAVDSSGNSMPINTGMFVLASLKYGDIANALDYFRKLNLTVGALSPGAYPEISNNSEGCYLQSWSAAIYVESVVEGFFGVHPDAGYIFSEPHIVDGIPYGTALKRLRFRGGYYDFRI
jgi:glycogen debranching enzyme